MNKYQITFTFHDAPKAPVIKETKAPNGMEALMDILVDMNEDGHYNKNIKGIIIYRVL